MAREDLIQGNIKRAQEAQNRAKAAKVAVNTPVTKFQEEVPTFLKENNRAFQSDHQSLLGANYSILRTLESINFVDGNDGGMYNSVAYIELWSSKDRTETKSISSEGAVVEPPSSYGFLSLNLPDDSLNFAKTLGGLPDFSAYTTQPNTPTSDSLRVQEALSPLIPSTELPSATIPRILTAASVDLTSSENPQNKVSGPIKPGNPGGVVSGATRDSLDNTLGYGGNSTSTSRGTGTIPQDSCSALGIWQFLFNPEEIDWEGGPEYGEAETWGVMDGDNSGKPLFWKNMKNQRLTFSKVLLNGYVFGKRVELLEYGLKQLFMREDGNNSDGPPVLKLIWGQRTFGPCVLKDLRIKEKNWDDGILVNAEVSFTLEKIPEWIINDGYVDVARPSKQSIIGDVFVGPSSQQENRDVQPPVSPATPATTIRATVPAQKLETPEARGNLTKCGYAKTSIKNFEDLIIRSKYRADFGTLRNQYRANYTNMVRVFSSEYTKYINMKRYTPYALDEYYEKHLPFTFTRETGPMQNEFRFACLNAIAALKKVKINLGCPSDNPKS